MGCTPGRRESNRVNHHDPDLKHLESKRRTKRTDGGEERVGDCCSTSHLVRHGADLVALATDWLVRMSFPSDGCRSTQFAGRI